MNELTEKILTEINSVIIGKEDVTAKVLMAIIAKGHVLLEDVPGVGKTTLAVTFARTLGLDSRRVQFTSDTMPSDVLGCSIYNKTAGDFEFKPGAVMTNLLLADEINRTSSKTQSALLEAMEEYHVTVDGKTYPLPEPFVVLATQNPVGSAGTTLLPASQMDRFMIRTSMGYPDAESQISILRDRHHENPVDRIQAVTDRAGVLTLTEQAAQTHIADSVYETMKFTVSRQSGPGETRRGLLLRVCVLLLMLTGLLGMARSVLGLHSTAGWCVGLLCGVAAGTCLLLILTDKSGLRRWALLVPAAVIVLCLVCRNRVVPAAAQMTNRVLAQMQLRRQTTILPLTAEGGNPLFGIGAVSAAAGLLLALAAQFAGGFGTLLLIPLWLAAGTGYLQTDVWPALFSLGCILLPLTRRSGKKAGMQTAALTAALLALCAAAVLGFGVNGKLDPLPLRRGVSDAVHALRYEAGAQPLTEGRLDTGKAPERTGASMLELRRSDPEAMYLRGMTGAGYSDAGWAPLSGETLSGEADRLYWLSENGFSATTQLSVLANGLIHRTLFRRKKCALCCHYREH